MGAGSTGLSVRLAIPLGLALCLAGAAEAQRWPPYPGTEPTKAADSAIVDAGGVIVWTVTIYNDEFESDADATAYDFLPAPSKGDPVEPFDLATDLVSIPPGSSASLSGTTLTVSDIVVPGGGSETIVLRTRVLADAPDGTLICNGAFVHYTVTDCSGMPPLCRDSQYDSESRPPGATEPEPTCVRVRGASSGGPDLLESTKTVTDADGDGLVKPTDVLTWTITVVNTGDSDATSVIVTDVIDPAMTVVDPGTGVLDPGPPETIVWMIDSVAPGDLVPLVFVAEAGCAVGALEGLCNQATITAAELSGPVSTDDPSTPAFSDASCIEVDYEPPVADAGGPGPLEGPVRIGSGPCDPTLTYSWTPATGLDDASSCDPVADPVAETEYCLTVTDELGCDSEPDCVIVRSSSEPCATLPDPIENLLAIKSGDDVSFQWLEESLADGGYHVYRVIAKEDIPVANVVGSLVVDTAPDSAVTSGDDLGAVPGAPGETFFYQVVGVCSDGREGSL